MTLLGHHTVTKERQIGAARCASCHATTGHILAVDRQVTTLFGVVVAVRRTRHAAVCRSCRRAEEVSREAAAHLLAHPGGPPLLLVG